MTLTEIFNSVWPFIATIIVSSIPSWIALRMAKVKYDEQGGRERNDAEIMALNLANASQTQDYISKLQITITEQGQKVIMHEIEISSLKLELYNVKQELEIEKQKSAEHQAEINYLKNKILRPRDARDRKDDK